MAIEDIFRALDEQADAECSELVRAAEGQAEAILAEATAAADRIRQQRLQVTGEIVGQKAGKALNAAKLDNRKQLAAVRERVVQQVFKDAATKLAAMRETKEYQDVFASLAKEALGGVDGECAMRVDPADAGLAEQVAKNLGIGCEVVADIEATGGLVVSSQNDRVSRSNTFESRLAKAQKFTYARVSEILG
ncbi:MAG: V-type ATP synthase subunit E [Coriobacteriia bacterium]|nr:V-type ATP synthase subunit E [Coriobacteriia bacterium]